MSLFWSYVLVGAVCVVLGGAAGAWAMLRYSTKVKAELEILGKDKGP